MCQINFLNAGESDCSYEMQQFAKENVSLLEHKVVQRFLKSEANQQLLINAICDPTKKNYELLDLSFKTYNFNARFTRYISTTLYFYAINYDKKQRKLNNHFPLMIDGPIKGYEGTTIKDLLEDPTNRFLLDEIIGSKRIEDYVDCSVLYKAVTTLTKKQKEVIDLYYASGISEKEIGVMLNKSQQVVSKLHRKALAHIHQYIQKEGGL